MKIILPLALSLAIVFTGCGPKGGGQQPRSGPPAPPKEVMRPPQVEPEKVIPKKEPLSQPSPDDYEFSNEIREATKDRLWTSPLGMMFYNFVFDPSTPNQELHQAHEVVERVFSQVTLTLMRLSAVQLMIEDLYERQLVTPEINGRISLLETAITLKRHSEEAQATYDLFKQVPVFAIIGFAGGSPLVRRIVSQVGRFVWKRGLAAFGVEGAKQEASEAARNIKLRRLLSREFFSDYSLLTAGSTFVQTFGGYSLIFFRLRSGSADSASVQEKIWLYEMQRFVDIGAL